MTDKQLLTLFPTTESNWPNENVRTEGALLRDYFAAKAMAGILVNTERNEFSFSETGKIASKAYELADAMLKARG